MDPTLRQQRVFRLFVSLSCLLLATWGAAPAAAEAPNLAATFQEYARRDASLEVLGSGNRAVDPLSTTSPTRPWRAGAIPPDLTAAQESAGAVDAAPAQLDAIEALNFTAVTAGIYYTCGLTASGGSGSTFTITGWNFPPGAQGTLSINGHEIATNIQVNPTGGFVFFLDTSGAGPGWYSVTVSVNPNASTGFTLADDAPLRSQEGGGQVFVVPGGIGWQKFVHLPLVVR